MLKYKVNVTGIVSDTDTDFKCSFDFNVANGGSFENVGKALQNAVDVLKDNGSPITPVSKED